MEKLFSQCDKMRPPDPVLTQRFSSLLVQKGKLQTTSFHYKYFLKMQSVLIKRSTLPGFSKAIVIVFHRNQF